jgi:anti-sigma factor RsiW
MNQTPQLPISDELLSAYIDGDVTDAEKQQIEFAIANDPEIAWQVETLRQTVAILRNLPMIPAPHSFVLEEAQVADVLAARRQQRVSRGGATVGRRSVWQQLLAFFSSGNLALRNASAVAAALFVVVTMSRAFLAQGPIMPLVAQPEQAVMIEVASAPAESAADMTAGDEVSVAQESMEAQEATPAPMAIPEPVGTSTPLLEQDSGDTGESEMETMTLQTAPTEETAAGDMPAPDASIARVEPFAAESVEPPAEMEAARSMPPGQEPANDSAEQMTMGVEVFTESAVADEAGGEEWVDTSGGEAATIAGSEPAPEDSAAASETAGEEAASTDMAMDATVPASTEEIARVEEDAAAADEDVEVAENEPAEAEEDTPAPESTPEHDTVVMENSSDPSTEKIVVEDNEAEPTIPATSPTSENASDWNVWQTMQMGLLSLTLILLLLWLGSRRRLPE